MEKKKGLAIRFELICWLITALVTALLMYPFANNASNNPFFTGNILLIILFMTFTRYIFLLPYTFFSNNILIKMILGVLAIPVFIFSLERINSFQIFVDEDRLDALAQSFPVQNAQNLLNYLKNEYVLFGVGCSVSAVVLPIRLIVSVWKQRNATKQMVK